LVGSLDGDAETRGPMGHGEVGPVSVAGPSITVSGSDGAADAAGAAEGIDATVSAGDALGLTVSAAGVDSAWATVDPGTTGAVGGDVTSGEGLGGRSDPTVG
jgi:hypothetical protein